MSKIANGYKMQSVVSDAITGKTIATKDVEASDKANVLKAVGTLASEVRTVLGDTAPESAKLAEAETFTSGSLEATHQCARRLKRLTF